jgi:hypothetical protein
MHQAILTVLVSFAQAGTRGYPRQIVVQIGNALAMFVVIVWKM